MAYPPQRQRTSFIYSQDVAGSFCSNFDWEESVTTKVTKVSNLTFPARELPTLNHMERLLVEKFMGEVIKNRANQILITEISKEVLTSKRRGEIMICLIDKLSRCSGRLHHTYENFPEGERIFIKICLDDSSC